VGSDDKAGSYLGLYLSLVVIAALTLLVYKSFKALKSFSMKADWKFEELVPILWTAWIVVMGISAAAVAVLFSDAVTGLLNPEYWALQQLLLQ
jgi:hypothetical protein